MAVEKGEEKERDRDKERDREKDRDVKSKEKMKSKEKDWDGEKKDRSTEPDRDRAHEKEREREREKGKEHDRAKEKELEREKRREREKKKEKERLKKDKDRERTRNREKGIDKDKDREGGSGSDREKEWEDSERGDAANVRERIREKDWDKDKERERERGKERGSERDRERQKLKIKEKERDREKEFDDDRDRSKDLEGRDREKEREKDHQFEDGEKEKKRDDEKEKAPRGLNGSQPAPASLEEKIARMREERLKPAADKDTSEKAEVDDDDIQAWVKKSRKIEQRTKFDDKRKAAMMAKILAEQDNEDEEEYSDDEFKQSKYRGKDLAGLKVRHGFDKVMEGHAVVLTLKDANVLEGDDVNEAIDELESIEMAQQQAREDAYKAAKKKAGTYEDKFGNDITGLQPRAILPQYDDVVKDEGVFLNAEGGVSEEARARFEEVRQRLEGAQVSLNDTAAKLASDFYTEEDMLQFKKPKKKKKLRKREKLDIDELEAEAVAAGLKSGDLGSRDSAARQSRKRADEKREEDARKAAYQNAFSKAEAASRLLREENSAKPMEVDTEPSTVFGNEDDDELQRSIDRTRQAALKKQREGGTQSVVSRLAELNEEPSNTTDGREGNLVFTDTGEFCRSLQLDDAIIRRSGAAKDDYGEEDVEATVEEPVKEVVPNAGGWTEVVEGGKDLPTEEEMTGADAVDETISEASLGKGLAGALGLLKERGTLKETVDWGGRNMDKKRSKLVGIVDESNNQVGQRDILLDRVDEFGRTMTPKEAFRKLSHKFHGKGPGKMKQEKKMKQYHEDLRLKQMNSGDTPLMSMEKMREAQARMHTPYIVISGHIKPGQTSDPRSGFATVEKEPIGSLTPMLGDKGVGSLTPMLGDKKVEHFLGIKRKAEAGSMGPPPPKQAKFER